MMSGVPERPECAGPDCEQKAVAGSVLCGACESQWMRERVDVVALAQHLTDLAAQFEQWCADHGMPNPHE